MEKKFKSGYTWDFEKLEKWMSDLSAKGTHVEKPGLFRNSVSKDNSKQYIYRMDFQPDVLNKDKLNEYISLFADGDWEYIGSVGPFWHYFRKNLLSKGPFELYTDRFSLIGFYKRFRKGLVVAALVNLLIIAINLSVIFPKYIVSNLWTMVVPIVSIQLLLILFLGYGYIKMGQKVKVLGS